MNWEKYSAGMSGGINILKNANKMMKDINKMSKNGEKW